MYRGHQSFKLDAHALLDGNREKQNIGKFKPLLYAIIFLGAWIYAMSLYGN